MKVKRILVDKMPEMVTDCIFVKFGIFSMRCRILKKHVFDVCFTDKCPLREEKE